MHFNFLFKIQFFLIIIILLSNCDGINPGTEKVKIQLDTTPKKPCFEILGKYEISDSNSQIVITHYESTETLGATVDSGQINIPSSVINEYHPNCDSNSLIFISASELKLKGSGKIDSLFFPKKINGEMVIINKYRIKGKILGFYHFGFLFKVDEYEICN